MLECSDRADVNVAVAVCELIVATDAVYIVFRTDAKILIVVDEEFKLTCEVGEIFVVGSGGKKQNLAVLFFYKGANVLVSFPPELRRLWLSSTMIRR